MLDWKLISSDSHIVEPPNLWTDRMDRRFRDRGPRVISEPDGDWWMIDGTRGNSFQGGAQVGKRFERDMLSVSDVTVYTFLYPVLGTDSREKSRDIWCAKDKALAWRAWMLDATQPARATGGCDTAVLERNLALGRKHRITGTPALVFANGKRIPGALAAEQVRKELAGAG